MPVMLVETNRCIGNIRIFAVNQVAPHRFAGRLAQVHRAPFAALGSTDHAVLHLHPSGLQVNIPNQQFAQLHSAQAGIDQREDDRLVSMAKTQAHGEASAVAGTRFARVNAGFEHALHFFLGLGSMGVFLIRGAGTDFIAARGVFVAQPAQMGDHILGGDLTDLLISDMFEPLVEQALV